MILDSLCFEIISIVSKNRYVVSYMVVCVKFKVCLIVIYVDVFVILNGSNV